MTNTGHEHTFAVRVAACCTTIILHCNALYKQKSSPVDPAWQARGYSTVGPKESESV